METFETVTKPNTKGSALRRILAGPTGKAVPYG